MENGRQIIKSFGRREKIWLMLAVIVLSFLTVLVLWAAYFFVASIMVGWQQPAEPDTVQTESQGERVERVVVETDEVRGVETAVIPTATSLPGSGSVSILDSSSDEATLQPEVNSEPTNAVVELSTPVPTTPYLIIPSLGVTQTITSVPIHEGQWDISGLSTQVGHLATTGSQPGEEYAMTFIGHVTVPWPDTGPFADLILLEHGEEVIYRWNGLDYIYQVERIFRADPRAVDLLYVPDGEKIVLVTCSGWDFVDREYDERLVTRAVLVRTEPSPTRTQ